MVNGFDENSFNGVRLQWESSQKLFLLFTRCKYVNVFSWKIEWRILWHIDMLVEIFIKPLTNQNEWVLCIKWIVNFPLFKKKKTILFVCVISGCWLVNCICSNRRLQVNSFLLFKWNEKMCVSLSNQVFFLNYLFKLMCHPAINW